MANIDAATGFAGASQSVSGVTLLSHDGVVNFIENSTMVFLPTGVAYTAIASGYSLDQNGNVYGLNGALLVSAPSSPAPFHGMGIYGDDFYAVNPASGWVVPSGGGSWSSIALPAPGNGASVTGSCCLETPSGVGFGLWSLVQTPSGGNIAAQAQLTGEILVSDNSLTYIYPTPYINYAQALSYGANYLVVSPDNTYAMAGVSSGVAFFENNAGTWSIAISFSLPNVNNIAIGNGVSLVCQQTSGKVTPINLVSGAWTEQTVLPLSGTCAYITSDNTHALVGTPSGIATLELLSGGWLVNSQITLNNDPIQIMMDTVLQNGLVYALTPSGMAIYSSDANYALTYYGNLPVSGVSSFVIQQDEVITPSGLGSSTFVAPAKAPNVIGGNSSHAYMYMNYYPYVWNQCILGGVTLYNGTFGSPVWKTNAYPDSIVAGPSGSAYALCPQNLLFGTDSNTINLSPPTPMGFSVPVGLSAGVFDGTNWYLTGSLMGGIVMVSP